MYDDIFLFVKLVNHDNFRKLATVLNISQSTISRRIQNLEIQLKQQLIKRNSNGFVLTNEGEALYKRFMHYEVELNSALDSVTTAYNGLSGTLRIALQPTIAQRLISAQIPFFQKDYPGAKLIIKYVSDAVNMVHDNYDLAICSRMPTSQESKIRPLSKLTLKLFATPEYAKKFGIPQTLDELSQYPFVGSVNDDNTPMVDYVSRHEVSGEEVLIRNESNLYVNNMLHGLEMAKSNLCIVAVWSILVRQQLSRHELIPVLPEYSFGDFNCSLIKNHDSSTELERAFVKFIENCFIE
ncbi:MAG: LysR family transcriptional regulator [Burkholderiales bacterium]|jgi:DNA-binding transcriptional LysR family regulator|nr:LysR family transcriptional regulator [Burkholderiales bacterium]